MKSPAYWVVQFLAAMLVVFLLLATVYWLRGAALAGALHEAGVWGAITAAIYTGVAYRKARRCHVCRSGRAA